MYFDIDLVEHQPELSCLWIFMTYLLLNVKISNLIQIIHYFSFQMNNFYFFL